VTPADYLATVYHLLGFPPETTVRDIENRPIAISTGRVLRELI
jgi:hypothetical protein